MDASDLPFFGADNPSRRGVEERERGVFLVPLEIFSETLPSFRIGLSSPLVSFTCDSPLCSSPQNHRPPIRTFWFFFPGTFHQVLFPAQRSAH